MPGTLRFLFHFNGADGSTVFTDSAVGLHATLDVGASPAIRTAVSKYGGAALHMQTSVGTDAWIITPNRSVAAAEEFAFGGWFYTGMGPSIPVQGGSGVDAYAISLDDGTLTIDIGVTISQQLESVVLSPGEWHFWFVSRDAAGVIRGGFDGTFGSTPVTYAGSLAVTGDSILIGACTDGAGLRYDDMFMVTGDSVYTAAFTAPVEEFSYPLAGPPGPPPSPLPPFVSPTMKTYINRLSCTVGNAPGASGDIITVGAAALGRRTFGPEHDGAVVDVTITDGADWEVRLGCVYTHATATLTRGTLDDSSTGSAIALSASSVITVSPHARWTALVSNTATRVPLPSADPAVNYVNIMAAITEAGTGGRLVFPAGQTYLLGRDIQPLSGQTLQFGQSKLKLPDQVSSNLTAGVGVTTVATPNPTAVFNVASSTGFYVGQAVGLEDRTIAGQRTYSAVRGAVTAVVPGQVTVQFAAVAGSNLVVTINTTTFIETTATSHTFATGTTLCSIGPLVSTSVANSRIKLVDLELDGNRANNPFGQRWELCPLLDVRSAKSQVEGLYIYDAPTDGFYFAALGSSASDVWIDRCNSMSMHIGAASTTGAQQSTLSRLWLDSPGLGSAVIGHYGGISNSFPAYPALGFSRLTDHLLISDAHISNSLGTISTIGQAIGCITANDNFAIDFSNIHISGFNKGRGAIHISATGVTAPLRIDFNQMHVDNCGPLTPGTFNAHEVSLIGNTSGTPPFADRVTIRNSEFTDSPLAIRAANVALENVSFVATAVANTATLTMLAGAASQGRVELSNVRSTRPTGSGAGAPAANEYATCMLANAITVRGSNVSCLGGHLGMRVQNAADVEISGLRCENNYNYGVLGMDGSTRLVLRSPRVRVTAGTTVQTPYAGIDLNSGGGALGASGYCSITAPDIDIVTTAASQYGIRLSPTAAVPCAVVGGKVKVSGTSTTPVLSGGASGVGVVATVALSHAFTPGAAEVSSGNVVSTNL
jgi:hypothetical protein